MAINAPRGTQDVLPSQSYRWQFLEKLLLEAASLFGYSEIRTPTFEQLDLFCRGVGDTTDVVQKEMFEVKPQKGDDLFALRPEGTAGVVRAALQNGLLNDTLPLKVCYILSCFRHERPQAGRFREFHQFGCECFGPASPSADVELISLAAHIIRLLGLSRLELNINSIGCKTCRAEYHKALKEYFSERKEQLCPTCIERLDRNPMRLLDCKSPECRIVAADAPIITDYLCGDCRAHFKGVQSRLSQLGLPFVLNPRLVRGLDYYTRTVFEFVAKDLNDLAIFAGGRYDGLVEELDGKPTPGLGFGMGMERLLLVCEAQGIEIPTPRECDLYIGSIGAEANEKACALAAGLRGEGFIIECDLMDRSVKAQMKYANKIGARMSMILGDNELASGTAVIKDMASGEQKSVEYGKELTNLLYDAMLAREAEDIAGQIGPDAFQRIMKLEQDKNQPHPEP